MRKISGLLNSSIEQLPPNEYEVLASSYEDKNSEEILKVETTWSFILDTIAPGQFVMLFTGDYLVDPKNSEHELYDNYDNRVILVRTWAWEKFKGGVAGNEKSVRKGYNLKWEVVNPDWDITD